MARAWTDEEKRKYRSQLRALYTKQNKPLREISALLHLSQGGVYDRLVRLRIPIRPERKPRYLNRRNNIVFPRRSAKLGEFLGIMLGDGHISHFQTIVTLGSKEESYVLYVQTLMKELFGVTPAVALRPTGYRDVYIGSTALTGWLRAQGLVSNKVAGQVGVPDWIWSKKRYMCAFVRGFFDTDGSVYRLKFGIQLSFTNRSRPLLLALQAMLRELGYKASEASLHCVYVTRRSDIERFFRNIAPANAKHRRRFSDIMRRSYSGNYTAL